MGKRFNTSFIFEFHAIVYWDSNKLCYVIHVNNLLIGGNIKVTVVYSITRYR